MSYESTSISTGGKIVFNDSPLSVSDKTNVPPSLSAVVHENNTINTPNSNNIFFIFLLLNKLKLINNELIRM